MTQIVRIFRIFSLKKVVKINLIPNYIRFIVVSIENQNSSFREYVPKVFIREVIPEMVSHKNVFFYFGFFSQNNFFILSFCHLEMNFNPIFNTSENDYLSVSRIPL